MNALTIKDPADLLSFIGHTLGFWPQESLVAHHPRQRQSRRHPPHRPPQTTRPGGPLRLNRRCLPDHRRTSQRHRLRPLHHTTPEPGEARPHRATIAALTGVLAQEGITIRDGIYVTDTTYSPFDALPGENIAIPVSSTECSQVNAEFIYRGSSIAHTNQIALPTVTHKREDAVAVEHYREAILNRPPAAAIEEARRLWSGMLSSKDYPTDKDVLKLVAYFQFPHIRDQLMADIPGIDEPPEHILFAQTTTAPNWSRIEWAKDLLLHTYIRTSPQYAAPILTTIGYINWWEGRGSKAHQYLQLALDADPGYRFARLTDHMLGAGIIAGWNTNKNSAYRNNFDMP
ncbi:DUF4192 family protein [Paenarthrobacter nicotinovorans]|uniref:DUF4192 family protein n=1 Tax=Paenarthrobacter nicotinovorans TaxID=29320 RepID=UPI0039A7558E